MHLSWHYTDRFGTSFGECPIGRSSTPRIGWQSFREEDGQLSYAARHSIAASNGRQGSSAPGSPLIHELSNPVRCFVVSPKGRTPWAIFRKPFANRRSDTHEQFHLIDREREK